MKVAHQIGLTVNFTLIGLLLMGMQLHAQVNVVEHNYRFFTNGQKEVSEELAKRTGTKGKQHPEYGTKPFHTQCKDCEEVVDKRTVNSRYYLQKGTKGKGFYVQQSYTPLHYKDKQGRLISLDPRIRPHATNTGYYQNTNQPVTTFYDEKDHSNGLIVDGVELRFNQHLQLYFLDENQQQHPFGNADRTNSTVGDEGSFTTDAWNGIDMEELYKTNGIETSYRIKKPLQLPSPKGWLVFEDKFAIPKGCRMTEDPYDGYRMEDSTWIGGYLLVNANDRVLAKIHPASFSDDTGRIAAGRYKLQTTNDTAILSMLIPASFLNNPQVKYPVFVDPYVSGYDSIGEFWAIGNPPNPNINGGTMGFSNLGLGCPHDMIMTIPGKCKLYDAYVDLEYKITQLPTCPATPSDGSFKCNFPDLEQRVKTPCVTQGYSCSAANVPYDQTCTTDPAKVNGAAAISASYASGFISCYPPQCPDYVLTFTLYNKSKRCPDNCSFNCATGTFWAMTIRGRQVEDTVSIDKQVVCAGSTIKLTNYPTWGVPPYTYTWSNGNTDSLTTDNPLANTLYDATVTDACGIQAASDNFVEITTTPSPPTDGGTDKTICKGAQATLGGAPTAPAGDTILWTAQPPYALAWLSANNIANPTISPPTDSVGTYLFIVRAADPLCFRSDSVLVITRDNPDATLLPNPAKICVGSSVTLATDSPYASYLWSTGATTATIEVTTVGDYSVRVTDTSGCVGLSDTVTPSVFPLPVFTLSADPDTTINYGDSAILSSSLDLTASTVQSYIWSLSNNINCTDCPTPEVKPITRQYYSLEVTSSDGCKNSDSILIIVHYPNKYWIANAFSPNKDGLNDKFYIRKESGVLVKEFKVYNRWGYLVHDNPAKGWDGTVNGVDPAPIEVYTFYFALEFLDGHKEVAKGNVTLIR